MALNAQGSYIKHSDNSSPSSYAKIEQVTSINGPDGQAAQIDVTHLESTGKEYLPGLADFGNITLECNFIAGTEQMRLKDMYDSSADAEQFHLFIPTSSAKTTFHGFGFLAIVTKWSLAEAVDDKVKLSITLKVSGAVDYLGTSLT